MFRQKMVYISRFAADIGLIIHYGEFGKALIVEAAFCARFLSCNLCLCRVSDFSNFLTIDISEILNLLAIYSGIIQFSTSSALVFEGQSNYNCVCHFKMRYIVNSDKHLLKISGYLEYE